MTVQLYALRRDPLEVNPSGRRITVNCSLVPPLFLGAELIGRVGGLTPLVFAPPLPHPMPALACFPAS